jgi:cell division septum initiation protein DivIVA
MGEQVEVDKLKDQLARAMKGFTVTKQQLQLKIAEVEETKNQAQSAEQEAAQLREERDSGENTTTLRALVLPRAAAVGQALRWALIRDFADQVCGARASQRALGTQ